MKKILKVPDGPFSPLGQSTGNNFLFKGGLTALVRFVWHLMICSRQKMHQLTWRMLSTLRMSPLASLTSACFPSSVRLTLKIRKQIQPPKHYFSFLRIDLKSRSHFIPNLFRAGINFA